MEFTKESQKTISKRLKNLRKTKKMTQLMLATSIGVSQETISSIERKKSIPKLINLIAICKEFNCSLDYIVGLSDIKNISVAMDSLNSTQRLLISNFNECDKKSQNALLALSIILSQNDFNIDIADNIAMIKNLI